MPGTPKMELFVTIVNNWKQWTFIKKTCRGLDPTVVKYDFAITAKGFLPHGFWIELDFWKMKNYFLPNTIIIKGGYKALIWSFFDIFLTDENR